MAEKEKCDLCGEFGRELVVCKGCWDLANEFAGEAEELRVKLAEAEARAMGAEKSMENLGTALGKAHGEMEILEARVRELEGAIRDYQVAREEAYVLEEDGRSCDAALLRQEALDRLLALVASGEGGEDDCSRNR